MVKRQRRRDDVGAIGTATSTGTHLTAGVAAAASNGNGPATKKTDHERSNDTAKHEDEGEEEVEEEDDDDDDDAEEEKQQQRTKHAKRQKLSAHDIQVARETAELFKFPLPSHREDPPQAPQHNPAHTAVRPARLRRRCRILRLF
ncbi:hypothetical protein PMKS-001823 [Pichia membranifaciens]|uniref:Uncharacterized protein n=1 Tax=Pichia membranifaciens TaxID=4926 RepID=A0A1Q2YFM4_9ASCO|nr:hypothetical protein PMKS-001823 [Pichia membranifaciens]